MTELEPVDGSVYAYQSARTRTWCTSPSPDPTKTSP